LHFDSQTVAAGILLPPVFCNLLRGFVQPVLVSTSRIISTAANHFGALGFGLPSGVCLPAALKSSTASARKVLKVTSVVTNFYTTLTMNLYKQDMVWPYLKSRSMTP
jgi:hypothetical protein